MQEFSHVQCAENYITQLDLQCDENFMENSFSVDTVQWYLKVCQ